MERIEYLKRQVENEFDELEYMIDEFVGSILMVADETGTDKNGAVDYLEINYEIKRLSDELLKITKFWKGEENAKQNTDQGK